MGSGFVDLARRGTAGYPLFGMSHELLENEPIRRRWVAFWCMILQQMTAMLAILSGVIFAGWLFDQRFTSHGGGADAVWKVVIVPLLVLSLLSLSTLILAMVVPRVPAQGKLKFSPRLVVSHFSNLAGLWKDIPLRRASFGVAFFWGFAAFINLWSIKLAKTITSGGESFGTLSSLFIATTSLGMAIGFGFASYLLRKRIELGWVPVAGILMTITAIVLAFTTPGGWIFLSTLGFLAFSGAVFLTPLTAWMQDRYPAEKRGELQAAVHLQDCIAGILAVVVIGIFEYAWKVFKISETIDFRLEIAFIGIACGLVTLFILRLLPGDFIRLVGGAIVRWIYRIQVVNPERIPPTGGALLLPNHVTFADGLFISAACPRPVRFVMDEAFMATRSIRLLVSIFDTVTIRKDQPREAIRITIDALKKGDLVCLFPEGQLTRTGTLNELRRGFEIIAKKAGHPLIPMWCDGSWGSIFSFERGRFFRKRPYHSGYGMTVAFGHEINPASASLEIVKQGLLMVSGVAVGDRFQAPSWGRRIPKGKSEMIRSFRNRSEAERRRFWVNGYQIGQVSALQRHQQFMSLRGDITLEDLPSIALTFAELFESTLKCCDLVEGDHTGSWVGGEKLRAELAHTQLSAEFIFYDFGECSFEPIYQDHLLHCPCLAVDGIVVSMSMPDPKGLTSAGENQRGHKLGTWGKPLPGWCLTPSEPGGLIARGPAAPADGLALPAKCYLDADGFLAVAK